MMDNQETFKHRMATLGELFGKEISQELAQIYWDVLKPYSNEQFTRAVEIHCRTGKFFPRPAELIDLMAGSANEEAAVAWLEVLTQLRNCKNVTLPESSAKVVAMLGGAEYLGRMNVRDLEYKRNQFIEIYVDQSPAQRAQIGVTQKERIGLE
jgi:uracil phosphoribosyltransferase